MMKKRGPAAVKEFTSAAWNQFGMRVVVLAAFMKDGHPSVSL
jgi:hypothetical protein